MAKLNTGNVKNEILDILRAAPNGKTSRELAVCIDRTISVTSTRLTELQATGRVAAVVLGRAKRWFAPEHVAAAQELAVATGGSAQFSIRPKSRRTTIAGALSPEPMRPGSGPKITIAPPFVDRRFTVDNPQPFFAAMPPGCYMGDDTAIARAYPTP